MSCSVTAEKIDAILPQTQCGLCGYKGCMPYAEALVQKNEAINLCPPGGVQGLKTIAELLNKDPSPFIAEMEQKAKPKLLAIIREAECIGCTLCIRACPVDAILGTGKQMHSVIAKECTGCELCVAPCPVDCIDIIALPEPSAIDKKFQANLARERFQSREKRLTNQKATTSQSNAANYIHKSAEEKKNFIKEALARSLNKKPYNET